MDSQVLKKLKDISFTMILQLAEKAKSPQASAGFKRRFINLAVKLGILKKADFHAPLRAISAAIDKSLEETGEAPKNLEMIALKAVLEGKIGAENAELARKFIADFYSRTEYKELEMRFKKMEDLVKNLQKNEDIK